MLIFGSFSSFLHKSLEKTKQSKKQGIEEMSTSAWCVQRPKAGQNIQHSWKANVLKDGRREKIFMDGKL